MCYGTLDDIYPVLKVVLKNLAVYTAFGYIVIAIVDRLFLQKNFTKQMMMTKDEAPLPKVVVSGMDEVAKIIRETALDEGIPIMENVPLARSLYAKVKGDDFIPVELAEPVAEVLKWVKSLNDAKKEEAELDSVEL